MNEMKQYTVKWKDPRGNTYVDEFHATSCRDSEMGVTKNFYIGEELIRFYRKDTLIDDVDSEELNPLTQHRR